jgi:hypothetical protein
VRATHTVIPAGAKRRTGIQSYANVVDLRLDSRLRGNDGCVVTIRIILGQYEKLYCSTDYRDLQDEK